MQRGEPASDETTIDYLADRIDHLTTLAGWHFDAFGYLNPGNTSERYVERLEQSLRRDDMPMTVVAIRANRVLGSASLVRKTITHPHLTPWLSSVFVAPDQRGEGLGSALVSRIESEAARLGFGHLHLFTPRSEGLYARLGWSLVEYSRHRDLKIAIMSKSIERPA